MRASISAKKKDHNNNILTEITSMCIKVVQRCPHNKHMYKTVEGEPEKELTWQV